MTTSHPDTAALAAEALLPCPFCGSESVSVSQGAHADGKPWPYIECAECAACAEPAFWNRRAAQALARATPRVPHNLISDRDYLRIFDEPFAESVPSSLPTRAPRPGWRRSR
jgi:hypothetical protein